ncbi:glycine zipper domain-containing protein [Cupriavidus sp. 30B13]|uniref:glycine zipper domain-containing protein n=1 Tax=Cupriavidus sp. 30B13 TaxID=3384241 RepID=UPI003B8F40D9
MLTHNPKVRKEFTHLADSAGNTVRQMRHAARDTRGAAREAAGPVAEEVRSLIAQLEHTVEVLGREGSSEAVQAGRRLQDRARALGDHLRQATLEGASRAREQVDHAVEGVQQRVVESPLKAIGIAAAVGAFIGLLLAVNGRSGSGNGN